MGQFVVDRPATGAQGVESPEPPPLINLTDDERGVYEYLCAQLRGAGIEHLTAGMPIAIIVRTYADWIEACRKCENEGRTQQSKNGWHSPTPWAEDEKRLKMELGQWLPKACLTIPSLVRVRKESGAQSGQDDLFGDLVQHATASPSRGLPN
jgi:hypothetical protein